MAGVEGFEPSYLVLETRVLTVGRHPYIMSFLELFGISEQLIFGDVYGIRTRIYSLRGYRPKPLDEDTIEIAVNICSGENSVGLEPTKID